MTSQSTCDRCGETVADIDAGFSPAAQEMKHDCGGTWIATSEATPVERGNGLPTRGDLVPGDDGELYRVISVYGPIHTSPSGSGGGNYVHARLQLADWDDTESDDDVFPASAILETD
jgi:hypothetical protein